MKVLLKKNGPHLKRPRGLSKDAKDKISQQDESLKLLKLAKDNFKIGEAFRSEDLGRLANLSGHEVVIRLSRIKNKELFGVVLWRISQPKGRYSWYFSDLEP